MKLKYFCFFCLTFLCGCLSQPSYLDSCFDCVRKKIASDSILDKIKYSSIDSFLVASKPIAEAVLNISKSDKVCIYSTERYFYENKNYSITVNNLIMFQQFQSYLKNEPFDKQKVIKKALAFEAKLISKDTLTTKKRMNLP